MNNELNERKLFSENDVMPDLKWMGDQIPGGFFIYKASGNLEVIYVNKTTLRIFGCESVEEFKELTGNTFKGMVYPEDYAKIQKSIHEQIADKRNENIDYVEYRIVRKDGSIRWVDDYGHFANMPGYGDVYYVFIIDVTEQHNSRIETKRRANVYSAMLEQFNTMASNSLAVMRNNLTTNVIEDVSGSDLFNTDYVGGSVADSIQVRIDSFLLDSDKRRYEETFRIEKLIDRFYKAEGPIEFVGYSRRQSGRQCFVKYTRSVTIDPVNGDIIAFGIETEYNNEKVSEVLNDKVLVKQYDMVAYLADGMYSIIIGDPNKKAKGSIFPKQRFGSYENYIQDQVIETIDKEGNEAEDIRKALSLDTIEKKLENEESYTVDVNCNIDDEIYNKRFTFYPVDKDARIYLLLKSDVTDVLSNERERNRILAEALQEAEHANAAKTSFLSNMSHEIRTPMNAIIGLGSIAMKDPDLSDQTRNSLEKINESAKHLLSLINDILDMSRIESGRMILKKEEFSFSAMLEQINNMVQTQCKEKNLLYDCRILGKIDEYYFGDDMKIKQILINILSNAVKFTNEGGILFTVEKIAQFDKHSTLRFRISDTGIGMSKEYLEKLYLPFTQEDTTTKNKYGSTGLGMAITKNIVEMMNGQIDVESEKGKGTTFTVTLTLQNVDTLSRSLAKFDPNNFKVLIVDDDVVSLVHSKMVLEEVGIDADTCESVEEVLHLMEIKRGKLQPYDLILIDWKMPETDGIELTRIIREKYNFDTTIIILTAYNWDDITNEAIDAGVDSFMSKPLFVSNVLDEFERVVNSRSINEAGNFDLTGKRILVAEDVSINADIMKMLLEKSGIEAQIAENGSIALEMFSKSEENYYDAILMDVRMPVMDGLEATSRIRQLERKDATKIPIIALTANAFDEDVQRSLQAGMNAHLSKPVDPDTLFKTLKELIYNSKKTA